MSTYERTHRIEGIADVDDAVERLVEFYRHNGYKVADRADDTVQFRRGRPRGGWFSSEMTQLQTTVHAEPGDDTLSLEYTVDTSGQWLTDEDRQFWSREAEAAEACVNGADPVDLRDDERQRAGDVTSEIRRTGLQAMFIIVILVVGVMLVAHLMG